MTANDKIEADIQLAGLNPMSWPNEVHADALSARSARAPVRVQFAPMLPVAPA